MPTKRFGKVYRLLKNKKAKVVQKEPFTIKLLYDSTNYTQDLTLGVDTGSSTLATAVSGDSGNVVYMSEVKIRNDIADKMIERSKYRRDRRNRKTRYRKARWLNRKNSIKSDRFSPTMVSKLNSHIREIEFVKKLLPITNIVLETGKFDITLLKHEGEAFNRHWGYQKGRLYGFSNVREYVLDRDDHTCQYCKGKHKDSKLEVHHIIFRSQGGSDEVSNLITLCHTCHEDLHNGKIKLNKIGKVKSQLKHATQMNSIRCQLLKYYPEVIETFGFITKQNRLENKLEKEHYFDAVMIATNGQKPIFKTDRIFRKRVIGKENRSMSIFRKVPVQIPKGKINGFRRYDKVLWNGQTYFIYGRSKTGPFVLQDIFGNKPVVNDKKTLGSVPSKQLSRVGARKSVLIA